MTSKKSRLDRLLLDRGLAASRQRAAALILAGRVTVEGRRAEKAAQRVAPDARVEVVEDDEGYVSRGGIKLAGALDAFSLSVAGLVAMDVGASTGGFTDCLLRRGARRVYAVDVGYGQLAWKLRQDARVVVLERTNVRYLEREQIPEPVDLATVDTSFISLTKVIPRVIEFLGENGRLLALIKPQFEVGRGRVGRGGVVRQPALHQQVVSEVERFCRDQALAVGGVVESPLLGPKGNREFFILAVKPTP